MPATDLITLTADEMAAFVRDKGWPRYHAHQILRWLYQHRVTDVTALTDTSKDARTQLAMETRIGSLSATEILRSEDGTRKFIFPLDAGKTIESVLIPDDKRLTLCL